MSKGHTKVSKDGESEAILVNLFHQLLILKDNVDCNMCSLNLPCPGSSLTLLFISVLSVPSL